MALDRLGNAAAGSIGINQTDLICLNLLMRRGPMSPSQIAAELGLTTAAISAVATRLEAGGYAQRAIDPADRRRILMSASAEGTQKAFGLFDDLYAETAGLTAGIRPAELRRLEDLLRAYQEIVLRKARALR
jgi:DNA-binding MarR family transcriptional regulator